MKIETIVPQQYIADKHNHTGKFGQGYLVRCINDDETVASIPTLEQAEAYLAKFQAKNDGKKYEIVSAGLTDSARHAANSPFRFNPK